MQGNKRWSFRWSEQWNMRWSRRWNRQRIVNKQAEDRQWRDKQLLYRDLERARTDWQHALYRLDYVIDPDQIDYAIYALEAAQKRYTMLLNQARQLDIHVLRDGVGGVKEG